MTNYIIRKKGNKNQLRRVAPDTIRFNGQIAGYSARGIFFESDEYNQAWRCANGMKFTLRKVA